MKKRRCGILMHITSLPSKYGIGTMGAEAERFVQWLKSAGQGYWQVLPTGPTGYGDSPYQPFSSFAGNPLMIDLDELCDQGLLSRKDCEDADYGADPDIVDYDKVSRTRSELLHKACAAFEDDVGYTSFNLYQADWLEDYALFMALKSKYGGKPWNVWDDDVKLRKPDALNRCREELSDEIRYQKFCQYIFFRQWTRFHRNCNSNGVKIIGDIPIYVSPDSSDVWANPDIFELDERGNPCRVAGVPPDVFSKTGQLWGNPLYNWQAMKNDGYSWWVKRVKKAAELYDMLRIDHFRAFDTYWAVPFGQPTAEFGKWEQGPGMDLFSVIKREVPNVEIIAEDLGDIFDSTRKLLSDTGFPGMKVLQFAFNDKNEDSDFLPHNYPRNCVCYTGTHDNATFKQWYKETDAATRNMAKHYLEKGVFDNINSRAVRAAYASRADLVIIPMQDVLNLGARARMNVPSTLGGNWAWRMKPNAASARKAEKLRSLAGIYMRL